MHVQENYSTAFSIFVIMNNTFIFSKKGSFGSTEFFPRQRKTQAGLPGHGLDSSKQIIQRFTHRWVGIDIVTQDRIWQFGIHHDLEQIDHLIAFLTE